mmetsp:Transcript_36799/g.68810  ORF Transcript_36799/g.68810 Transcript_36799/m.68810 type:complete len:119 (+) Transcript_36799:79-435(+)
MRTMRCEVLFLAALASRVASLTINQPPQEVKPPANFASDIQQHIHWECEGACARADTNCIAECETEMYNCILHFQDVAGQRPSTLQSGEAEKDVEKCQAGVLKKAKEQRGPAVGDKRG